MLFSDKKFLEQRLTIKNVKSGDIQNGRLILDPKGNEKD